MQRVKHAIRRLSNKGGSEAQLSALLARIFEPLAQFRATTPKRCAAFVEGDDDPSLFADIAKYGDQAAHELGLCGDPDRVSRPARNEFYAQAEAFEPAVLARFGKLLNVFAMGSRGTPPSAWPETLVRDSAGRDIAGNTYRWATPQTSALKLHVLEAAMIADGQPAERIVAAAFDGPQWGGMQETIATMEGFAESVVRHAVPLRATFERKEADRRIQALTTAGRLPTQVRKLFAAQIARALVANARKVRAEAAEVTGGIEAALVPHLREHAVTGTADERAHAAAVLWRIAGTPGLDDVRTFVRERAKTDGASGVRDAIAGLVADAPASTGGFAPPPLPAVPPLPELSDRTRALFDTMCASLGGAIAARPYGRDRVPVFSSDVVESLWRYVQNDGAEAPSFSGPVDGPLEDKHLEPFLAAPDVTIHHVVRLFAGFGRVGAQSTLLDSSVVAAIERVRRRAPDLDLLTLESVLATFGVAPVLIAGAHLWPYHPLAATWPDDAVWPFYARHIDLLIRLCDPANAGWGRDEARVYGVVAMLPVLPADLANHLFELALGTGKSHRALAQAALAHVPAKVRRIEAALANPKAEARAVAANWLRDVRDPSAVPALEAALQKEKHDVAASAMIGALERLGVPVERFLSRDTLLADARKGIAKGLPRELAWFPAAVPVVHWSDSGEAVEPDILRWFLAQSCKLKSPEPGGVLRRYAASFERAERERFGEFVLDAWLREDIKPIARDHAERNARATAAQYYAMLHGPYADPQSPLKGKSEDELYRHFLPGALSTPAGSAIAAKGILAVAAACCGASATPLVQRYLKEWYGTRAAQGKALIAMLAWIEDPSATQLLLSIASRFRTKGFQDEALVQAQLLAGRKDWTIDELSDRTIPTGGFDDAGVLRLSYGPREFAARLDDALRIELADADGRAIAALPAPRKDDDAGLAAEAKSALANAKKQLKTIVTLQAERLYEALCTGRQWAFADWQTYLNGHPIMRRLCTRLVWQAAGDGDTVRTFRPLPDGSLTDVDDDPVTIEANAAVTLAHDSTLGAEKGAAWARHLGDYDVSPLFVQFGRPQYALDDDHRSQPEIADVEGHMIDSFALRGRATKLGWTRGPAEDGGMFFSYEKRFASLGVVAVLEFTGSALPEQRTNVALKRLSFRRSGGTPARTATVLALGDAPPILLSECWNDVHTIAADGTGFDPLWESKT